MAKISHKSTVTFFHLTMQSNFPLKVISCPKGILFKIFFRAIMNQRPKTRVKHTNNLTVIMFTRHASLDRDHRQ